MATIKQFSTGQPVHGIYMIENEIIAVQRDALMKINPENEKVEPLPFQNHYAPSAMSNNILVYLAEKHLVVYNYRSEKIIFQTSHAKFSKVVSLALSNGGMTLAIGQDNGKIVLIHTLTGSILGNYSVFTTKEKVKFVTFCTESLVAVANEHNIKILDIVQKKVILKNEQSHTIIAIAGSTDVLMFANKKREIQGIRFMRKHKEEFLLHKADDDIKSLTFSVNKQVLYALFSSGIALYEANVKGHIAPINVFFERGTSFFPVGEDQLLVAHGNGVVKLLSDIKAIDNTIKELLAEQSFEETVDSSKMVRHDNTIRFLTVDDSATMRMIIKNSIVNNFEDVEVYEAEDGVGAISTLEQRGDIDIMFLDWNMPIMNGPEVVKSIYKHKTRHGGVKIIMATTEASKEKVRSMVSKGVKGYLVKPFRAESITPLVEKMIEGIKKERT